MIVRRTRMQEMRLRHPMMRFQALMRPSLDAAQSSASDRSRGQVLDGVQSCSGCAQGLVGNPRLYRRAHDALVAGELRPGGHDPEWIAAEHLRTLRGPSERALVWGTQFADGLAPRTAEEKQRAALRILERREHVNA